MFQCPIDSLANLDKLITQKMSHQRKQHIVQSLRHTGGHCGKKISKVIRDIDAIDSLRSKGRLSSIDMNRYRDLHIELGNLLEEIGYFEWVRTH